MSMRIAYKQRCYSSLRLFLNPGTTLEENWMSLNSVTLNLKGQHEDKVIEIQIYINSQHEWEGEWRGQTGIGLGH